MHTSPFKRICGVAVLFLVLTSWHGLASAQKQKITAPVPASIDTAVFGKLEWRSIGPANMGGRTTDVEGVPGNPNVVYVATASGGLWKTTNGGMNWTPIFERQNTISIGDIALEPNNPDVIYVGTGESNTRNSVSFGDGVYKSTDGGKTWQHLGLKDSERISRIVINPLNPNMVYVGALGHAYGPNEERGVFMSTDAGKTWQKTLYIDNKHGVADLDIDPSNPNILYAGMWHFERKPWTHTSGSENGGVFKSVDGGRTWTKLTNGLPKLLGRIGVKVAPSNPNVVYVMVESKEGALYRSNNRGESFRMVSKESSQIVSRGFYYTDLRVDPTDENRVYAIASRLSVSIDGGKTFRRISNRTHGDYHTLWIDPQNPNRIWQGQDGGIAVSYDRGENWEVVNNIPLGQFYQLFADNRQPFYYLAGGLQDNGTWTGPSRVREGGIVNAHWRTVSGGDGYFAIIHPNDPDLYLSESQGGNVVRTDMRLAEQQVAVIQPRRNDGGPVKDLKYRFNWNTPLVLSPFDANTVYCGSQFVLKSTDFGKTWNVISPDLTTNDPEKQKDAGGPVWTENTTAEYHCTIISLAESPIKVGMIWVGTDDGNLQMTADGGKTWTNLTRNVAGIPAFSPVSHVEPSRTSTEVAYIAFDRHMFDDFRPHIFKTVDGGKTWKNISGNLPEKAYVHVVREDPKNTNLIYAGTELGVFASYTGGGNWVALNLKNLPTVAVHEILVHPRENDLILATHGRSIYIFDDATPIQQMSPELTNLAMHMFDIRPALRYATAGGFGGFGSGNHIFVGPNPQYGALVTYYLKDKPDDKTTVKMEILDASGKVIREMKEIPKNKGLNRTAWDLRHDPAKPRRPPTDEEREMQQFFGGGRGPQALPGRYTVRLTVGDKTLEKPVEVRLDPLLNVPLADLQLQAQHTLALRDMQTSVNEALKWLDGTKEQLEGIQKRVKDAMPETPEDLKKAMSENLQQVETLSKKLARPPDVPTYMLGPQLVERLGNLFGGIDRTNAAPTIYQQEYFKELQAEFAEKMTEFNAFVENAVPKLNETLVKHKVSTIMPGKAVSLAAAPTDSE
ncbi:MAG: hypothetical protein ONB46_00025 [candidate division KSB1 bacterium]|nr:hypothetical protein [candidate division KSB1 bacterium]MDZ7364770.1 hypothetical protein [candidate division KSB1 bacterium]MDZ7402482.1 hypothetical protein [candidate division KSB1 bacterium]